MPMLGNVFVLENLLEKTNKPYAIRIAPKLIQIALGMELNVHAIPDIKDLRHKTYVQLFHLPLVEKTRNVIDLENVNAKPDTETSLAAVLH